MPSKLFERLDELQAPFNGSALDGDQQAGVITLKIMERW